MPGFMLRAEPNVVHTLPVPAVQWEGWAPIRDSHQSP